MLRARVIPCLLLRGDRLVKTKAFRNETYIGDPINAVRILNDKEVDELVFLDIGATASGSGPNFSLLADIASEAFMPFGYGGGITSISQVRQLFSLGVEKVIINTAAMRDHLLKESVAIAGSSSVVASVDVRRNWRRKCTCYVNGGRTRLAIDPIQYVKELEKMGAGEIILNAIHRDGAMDGYDLDLIRTVSQSVNIPVVAVGGAGRLSHFRDAVDHGASAVGAGSMFVFHGKHRAVLITYPKYAELEELLGRKPDAVAESNALIAEQSEHEKAASERRLS